VSTDKTFHFISGLPRSGSTLLSAILKQNPRFHANMTSPVGALVSNMVGQFSVGSEFAPVFTPTQKRNLLRGVFSSYYAEQTDKEVVFDTNRLWCASMPLLLDLFPSAKVIACVRNVAWIVDSLERRYRANPYENTRLFNDWNERATVESRVETLLQRNRLVGFSWSALKEACYGEHAKRLLLIDYDLLSQAPAKVVELVYQFIGEPRFDHDFEHVQFDAPEFDAELGLKGLHQVRPKVELQRRRTVLPPDVFARCDTLNFWTALENSAANVITLKAKPDAKA
jgi:sulfotransferase